MNLNSRKIERKATAAAQKYLDASYFYFQPLCSVNNKSWLLRNTLSTVLRSSFDSALRIFLGKFSNPLTLWNSTFNNHKALWVLIILLLEWTCSPNLTPSWLLRSLKTTNPPEKLAKPNESSKYNIFIIIIIILITFNSNNHNPVWQTPIKLEYKFEVYQKILVLIGDDDDKKIEPIGNVVSIF